LLIFGVVVFVLSIAALPIIVIAIFIAIVFSIISIIFKFIFGGPLLMLMIIFAIIHFANRRKRF
jgi:hypothetical protein